MLEPTRTPSRYASVLGLRRPAPPGSRPRRYCSDACHQRAFRIRSNSELLAAAPALRPGPPAPPARVATRARAQSMNALAAGNASWNVAARNATYSPADSAPAECAAAGKFSP